MTNIGYNKVAPCCVYFQRIIIIIKLNEEEVLGVRAFGIVGFSVTCIFMRCACIFHLMHGCFYSGIF